MHIKNMKHNIIMPKLEESSYLSLNQKKIKILKYSLWLLSLKKEKSHNIMAYFSMLASYDSS